MSSSTTTSNELTYIYYVIFGLLFSIIAYYFLFLFQLGSPTETSRYFYEVNNIKNDIANKMHGRKILFIGGSNVLFGIKAHDVENKLGIPAVNMGITAGLGLDYILHKAEAVAKNNDILVLAIEYDLFNESSMLNEELIDYVLSRDPGYYESLPIRNRIDYIEQTSLTRVLEGDKNRIIEPEKTYVYYRSSTLNQFGDETWNKKSNQSQAMRLRVLRSKPISPVHITKMAYLQIKKFVAWCKKKHIMILATYPSTVYFKDYRNVQYVEGFNSILKMWKGYGVDVIGTPYDFMYPKADFFDTNYHLTQAGMTLRTNLLIHFLANKLDASQH